MLCQETATKLETGVALPASAIVRQSVDRFFDEIFVKLGSYFQFYSNADEQLPIDPEIIVALEDYLPDAGFALKLFPTTPALQPNLQS